MVGASRVLPVDESAAGGAARDGGGTPAEPSRADRTAFADGAIGFAVAALGLSALAWAFWAPDLADGWRGLLPVLALGVLVLATGVPGRAAAARTAGAFLGLVVAAALFVGLALAGFSS